MVVNALNDYRSHFSEKGTKITANTGYIFCVLKSRIPFFIHHTLTRGSYKPQANVDISVGVLDVRIPKNSSACKLFQQRKVSNKYAKE